MSGIVPCLLNGVRAGGAGIGAPLVLSSSTDRGQGEALDFNWHSTGEQEEEHEAGGASSIGILFRVGAKRADSTGCQPNKQYILFEKHLISLHKLTKGDIISSEEQKCNRPLWAAGIEGRQPFYPLHMRGSAYTATSVAPHCHYTVFHANMQDNRDDRAV